jgi:outer membrane protein TolC
MTVEEAIRIGLEYNLDIRIAKTEADMARNSLHIGKAGFLPKLDLTASQSRSVNKAELKFADGTAVDKEDAITDVTNAGLALNWTLFDGLSMFASFGRLKELKAIGDLAARQQIENTVAEIIASYYSLVREASLLRVLQEAAAVSEERVKLAESNLRLGSGSRFDMLRARVDLNADKSGLMKQETALQNARIAFVRLIGFDSRSDFAVEDSIGIGPRLDREVLRTRMLEQNADLLLAKRDLGVARFDVRTMAAKFYPKLSVWSNYTFGRTDAQVGLYQYSQNLGLNVGATLSFNLFNGFSDAIDLMNARLARRAGELVLENTQRILESDFDQRINEYEDNWTLVGIERENLEIARATLDIAREKLRVGTSTPLEYRESQNAYVDAANRLVEALYTAKQAETELLRMSGGLVQEKKP